MNEKLHIVILATLLSICAFLGVRLMEYSDHSIVVMDDAQEIVIELEHRRTWMGMIDDLAKDLSKDVEQHAQMIAQVKTDVNMIRQDTAQISVILGKIDVLERLLMRNYNTQSRMPPCSNPAPYTAKEQANKTSVKHAHKQHCIPAKLM